MTNEIQPIPELPKISRDILDDVKIGDWFWVKFEDEEWKDDKKVKVGEHEELMCVEAIGSNYVGFTRSTEHSYYHDCRVHFDNFIAECRPEPNWKQALQKRMDDIQKQMQEKTRKLREYGPELFLLPPDKSIESKPEQEQTMLPVKVADEPKRYKKDLVKFEKKLPEMTKEIDGLAKDYAVVAKDMALPDLVRLGAIKESLSVVSDRIFTIEIYAGLQEEVVQIADGEAAAMTEKVSIRQMMLFMDEETLFNYESGGMDFEDLEDFDKWIVKPENLNRMLPEQRGIVAFRVRRGNKDYGECRSFAEAFLRLMKDEENMKTYLLIRNGQRVYRIASAIDFSPRLIPKKDEIGEEQFKKVKEWYDRDKEDYTKKEELVTQDSVKFDDHMAKMDALIKKYNRVVILIQGLLDRSMVFHPHPPINLMKKGELDKWVNLIRDEETALPGVKITFKEYLEQLNKTLNTGKWIFVLNQYRYAHKEKYSDEYYVRIHGKDIKVKRPHRGYGGNDMPAICKVDSMKRDGSAVQVSWPKGENSRGKRVWVESTTKPGWGHYSHQYETNRMDHEWVPIQFVMNLSDYTPDDYKMFLCDRALQGQYLEWAGALLTAEDWARERAKGINPEDHEKAKARRK